MEFFVPSTNNNSIYIFFHNRKHKLLFLTLVVVLFTKATKPPSKSQASTIVFSWKMVQRKVVNKLGIPDDDVLKSGKRSMSTLPKPSSLQNHWDIMNRGTDLKKKMKKSGSMKQAGNRLPIRAEPPETESPACSTTTLPNYMKSTSSSVARKGKSHVSNKSSENFSKLGLSAASEKATKTLSRPNGLKTTRVLTKNPSFKPGRSLMNKCAEVVLSENLDVQRATCSSTLKDFKHPAYLVLNPGGTESGGTSVMKVCPYTYCSLNGYHHDPLPPLKSFLSSRSILKTQRNTTMICPTLSEKTPSTDVTPYEKLLQNGELDDLTASKRIDFFIEIYAQREGNTAGFAGSDDNIANDSTEAVSVNLIENYIDFHENLDEDEDEDGNSTDVDADEYPVAEGIPFPCLDPEGTEPGMFVTWNDIPGEILGCVQLDKQDSEASEMDSDNIDYEYLSCEEKMIKFDNCCNEFRANEASLETSNKGSLKSDNLSSNDDCESVVSLDYIDGVNNMNTSLPVVVQEEKTDATYEDSLGTKAQISDAGIVYYVADIKEDPVYEMDTCADKAKCDALTAVTNESDQPYWDGGLMIQTEENFKSGGLVDFAEDSSLEFVEMSLVEMSLVETESIIVNEGTDDNACDATKADKEDCSSAGKPKGAFRKINLQEDLITNDGFKLEIGISKRMSQESQEEGEFNPRKPNFLPLQPVPEAEKVDLRHQELDEKKNAEEWMVDYALRQTVTKLGPARKKKVELLVEAFEKVMPMDKCELKLMHGSALTIPEQFRHVTCN